MQPTERNTVESGGLVLGNRPMVAARVRPHFEAMAKERQLSAGEHGKDGGRGHRKPSGPKEPKGLSDPKSRASEQAGAALNVSRQSVDRARIVKEKGISSAP